MQDIHNAHCAPIPLTIQLELSVGFFAARGSRCCGYAGQTRTSRIRTQRPIPPIWTMVERKVWGAQRAQERSRAFQPLITASGAVPLQFCRCCAAVWTFSVETFDVEQEKPWGFASLGQVAASGCRRVSRLLQERFDWVCR